MFFNALQKWKSSVKKVDSVATQTDSVAQLLRLTKSLEEGKRIHSHILKNGIQDPSLTSLLLHMYIRSGSLDDARQLFVQMQDRSDALLWISMITAFANRGQSEGVLEFFRGMQQEGVVPNVHALNIVLNSCDRPSLLSQAKLIHENIRERVLDQGNVFIGTSLVKVYSNCGDLDSARKIYDEMSERSLATCSSIISAYTHKGHHREALHLFKQMLQEGISPNEIVFVATINACLSSEEEGILLHSIIAESGFEQSSRIVGNAIINMYSKLHRPEDAAEILKKMSDSDVISWTAVISAFALKKNLEECIRFFRQMQLHGVQANVVTFATLVNACSTPQNLASGKFIHQLLIESGIQQDLFLQNALVNMYCKSRSFDDAYRIFDQLHSRDLVAGTMMMTASAECGELSRGMLLFQQLLFEGINPNGATLVTALNLCNSFHQVKMVHDIIIESGYDTHNSAIAAILNAYRKHHHLLQKNIPEKIPIRNIPGKIPQQNIPENTGNFLGNIPYRLENIPQPDAVLFNAVIALCNSEAAMKEFERMQLCGIKPNRGTFVTLLSLCDGVLGGRKVHKWIAESGYECDLLLVTALINMYGKCGCVEDGVRLFERIKQHDIVSWTAMISVYAENSSNKLYKNQGLRLFRTMQLEGFEPDRVTLISILYACTSLSALTEGKIIHEHIVRQQRFLPDVAIENAVLSMYGKCGNLIRAYEIFQSISCPDEFTWSSMISAYAQHGEGDKSLKMFHKMKCDGYKPSSVTFISILTACSHAGLLDEGCSYFSSMIEDHCIVPECEHYGCMIDLFSRVGLINEVAQYVANKCPLPMQSTSGWSALLSACKVHGDVELGELAAKRVLELNPVSSAAHIVMSTIYSTANKKPLPTKLYK